MVDLSSLEEVYSSILINLTPLVPLSFSKRGGRALERGLRPLSYLHSPSSLKY